MTEIIALTVAADGGALVAVWPTRTCLGCRREAALGIIRLGTAEPRRNEFKCITCDESDLPAPNPTSDGATAQAAVLEGPAVTKENAR